SSPFWSSSPSWPPPWPSGPTTAATTTPTPLCTHTPTTTASLLSPTSGNEHFSTNHDRNDYGLMTDT
ncbi:hypothetical protein CEXT_498801, partial [Caerostris extrusa]